MIKEIGRVVQKDAEFIWVETAIKSTCSTCAAKPNCGTSSVAEAFAGKSVINKVKNTLDANLEDQVEIGIPEDSLVQGAFWIYILPIVTALTAGLATEYWLSQFVTVAEWLVILMTLAGGALGFVFANKKLANDDTEKYLPQLLNVLPQPIDITTLQKPTKIRLKWWSE